MPTRRHGTTDIVGRQTEIQGLRTALGRLRAGEGGAIALLGEPGIGKTRLLAVLAAEARSGGTPVIEALGYPADRTSAPGIPAWDSAALGRLVARAVEGTPVAVVLDDLHRFPPDRLPSVESLIRATATAPLLVVLAYRERQMSRSLAAALSQVAAAGLLQQWSIGPLSREQTRALVGNRPDVDEIYRQGLGNPRYLKVLAADGRADTQARTALLGELAGLPESALGVAWAAAVLVEPFDPELLAAVADLDTPDTLAAVDVLTRLDLLRACERRPLMTFRHPVVREIIYDHLPPSRRIAAHLRAEAALTGRGAPIAQRAYHVARAADPNRPEHVVTLIAAARETIHLDPATAAGYLDTVLTMVCEGDEHWYGAQVLLARARLLTGRVSDSRVVLQTLRSRISGSAVGDFIPTAADSGRADRMLGRYLEAQAVIRDGLAALPAERSPMAGALHTELADIALDRQEYQTAQRHAAVAATIARTHRDRTGEAMALAHSAAARLHTGDLTAAEASLTAAADLVDAASDAELIANLHCLYQLGMTEAALERLADAERHLARGIALSRRTGQRYILPASLKTIGETQIRAGRLQQALETLDEAGHLAARDGSPATRAIVAALRARALVWRHGTDDVGEAVDLVEKAAAGTDGQHWLWAVMVRCIHAEVMLHAGEPKRGRWLLLDSAGGHQLSRLNTWHKPRWCDLLAGAAMAEGDHAAVERWSALAESCVEQIPSPGRRGFARRARLRAHAARADTELLARTAEQAVEDFCSRELRIEAGLTLVTAASLLLDNGCTAGVTNWLDRSEHIAGGCGSSRLADEVARQRRRIPACADNDPDLALLTAREREVAVLTSTGMTSVEVARTLYLSVRTVDAHLGRIYRKLAVPNRAGLTRVMLTSGGHDRAARRPVSGSTTT